MVPDGFRIILCLLLLGAPLAAITPVHAGATPTAHAPSVSFQSTSATGAIQTRPDPTNNSSIRHERVAELASADEHTALSQWFATHLSSQLEASAITLSQGEYDRARALLGDEYNNQLAKLVDVAGETADTTDEQTADRLATTKNRQQDYVKTVQEYRETYRDYQAAKRAGNETQARSHARELNRLAGHVQQAGGNLTASYDILANQTGADLTKGRHAITRLTQNITAQQTVVRRETFVNTTVTIQQSPSTASFLEPIHIRGRLTATNGTALANRQIVMQVGPRTIRTRTSANGSFTVTLRPRMLAQGEQAISVRYTPRRTAVYLGATTTVPVTIAQVTPTVTLAHSPTTVAYNETVTVQGRVHAENVGAEGVPVQVTIGETVLGQTRTQANGTFAFTTTLPPGVPVGDQQLHVALPLESRALGPANTTAPLTVNATSTQLTVRQMSTDETSNIGLHGVLTTASGAPVAGQSIQLRVAGQTITTATTNQTGYYSAQLAADALRTAAENSSVTVTAVYPGPGNLRSVQAQTPVQLPAQATGTGSGLGSGSIARWVPWPSWRTALGGLVLAVLGGLALRQYVVSEPTSDAVADPTEESPADGAESDDDTDTGSAAPQSASQSLHDHADTLLAAGETDLAVQTAYAAVREQVGKLLEWDADQTATHTYWEFYQACHDHEALSETQAATLKRLTEHFERAQFTTTLMAADQARDAVDQATTFLSTTDQAGATETGPDSQSES